MIRQLESKSFLFFLRDHLRSILGITCGRGSFAVHFGDHLRSRDHLRLGIICGTVQCRTPWILNVFILKRIFFKSSIISQKGRWGVCSPWTTPKSTHEQVLIKGGLSRFKLHVTFYKLLDSHCNFPCTCMLKKHFRENLIPHVHTH